MKVSVQHFPQYTVLRLEGAPTLDEFIDFIHDLAAQSRQWAEPVVLVDLRGITTLRSFTEQFRIGEVAGTEMAHLRKIASVVPEDRITHTSEKAANHTGARLRVFTDESDAVRWLLAAG